LPLPRIEFGKRMGSTKKLLLLVFAMLVAALDRTEPMLQKRVSRALAG
jgi:hypothetical protein